MSKYSLSQLKRINELFDEIALLVKAELPKIYSKELIEVMFSEFYLRIASIEKGLGVTRKTAANYLNQLVEKEYWCWKIEEERKSLLTENLLMLLLINKRLYVVLTVYPVLRDIILLEVK